MKPKVKDAIFILKRAAAELTGEVVEGVGRRMGIMEDGSKLGVHLGIEVVAADEAGIKPD